jgi:predicted HTH transcriptional regulator
VSAFANADLEALGGFGYIVFGVSDDGSIVGIGGTSGDPPSDARQIVNSNLGRPVAFEFVTCDVDDKAGDNKRVAAIVVPDSRRRPHVVRT